MTPLECTVRSPKQLTATKRRMGASALLVGFLILLLGACDATVDAVVLDVGANHQEVLAANPAGTTYIFEPGVHPGVHLIPKDGDVFIGAGDGSSVLDGLGSTASAFRSFVHLGDPTTANVTLVNLSFTNYGINFQNAIVDASSEDYVPLEGGPAWAPSTNWTMVGLRFFDNGGTDPFEHGQAAAIKVGSGSLVKGVSIDNQAGQGIIGHGRDIVIEDSSITNSSDVAQYPNYHSGGIKLVTVHDTIIRNNIVSDNTGPGIWIDINGDNVEISGNTVENNSLAGIYYEISRRGTITNNIVNGNGGGQPWDWFFNGGISISSSNDNTITGNQLSGNQAGITVVDQRTLRIADQIFAPGFGQIFEDDGTPVQWRAENNTISGNHTVDSGRTGTAATGDESLGSNVYATTTWVNNTYEGENQSFWWWYGPEVPCPGEDPPAECPDADRFDNRPPAQQTLLQWRNDHGNDVIDPPPE